MCQDWMLKSMQLLYYVPKRCMVKFEVYTADNIWRYITVDVLLYNSIVLFCCRLIGEKPHACDVCGKAFSTSSSLNTHRRIHSGEKPHQCPVCFKCFTASSNLYYHRMTHKKEKPHKCTLCTKSFPTPGDLKSHQFVHNGSWPFKCSFCGKGFGKQANLKSHMVNHAGQWINYAKIMLINQLMQIYLCNYISIVYEVFDLFT